MADNKSYSEKLKHPKWQRLRTEVLQRDDFTCRKCGDKETTLHVHHLAYNGAPWKTPKENLITVCEHCHNEIEFFVKNNLLKREKIEDISILKYRGAQGGWIVFLKIKDNPAKYISVLNSDGQYVEGFDLSNHIPKLNEYLS